MKDKSTLKVLQSILADVEGLAAAHRTDPKVSKALRAVYQSVAIAGGEIIDKMTRDARREKEERDAHKTE